MKVDSLIVIETMAILHRADPAEVRSHLRGLADHVAKKSAVEDLAALAAGEDVPGEFNPPREVLMARIDNAADWLLASENPLQVAQSGHLVLTLAKDALRHWGNEQMEGIAVDS